MLFIQFLEGMYALWKRKITIVVNGWETGSPWRREENEFNISLRDSDVPRNIFRNEALMELINMTHSLKRVILNENWTENSTKCTKHWWKFCEVEIRNFKTQNVGIIPISPRDRSTKSSGTLKAVYIIYFSLDATVLNMHPHWTYSVQAKIHNRLLCELGWSLILNNDLLSRVDLTFGL